MKLPNLKTDFLGKEYIFYKQIDSTQSEVWRLIKNNVIQNGTLVMADIQTKGKGTHGRIWHTDEGENIAFSFYIKAECQFEKLEGITIEIAEILVDIFRKKYNIKLDIKEPNDIMYNNKKIGGILTESKINTEKMNFSEDIKNIATSIKKEFGIKVNRLEIISDFCNEFEKRIKRRIV